MSFNMTVPIDITSTEPPASCILYQEDHLTIIDIPLSISRAQGTPQSPCRRMILSCEPLSAPFPTNEPKSDAAKARLKAKMGTKYDDLYAHILSQALATARREYHQEWCLPRFIAPKSVTSSTGQKRKASSLPQPETQRMSASAALQAPSEPPVVPVSSQSIDPHHEVALSNMLSSLATQNSPESQRYQFHWRRVEDGLIPLEDAEPTNTLPTTLTTAASRWDHHIYNPTVHSRFLDISSENLQPTTFLIPPTSACYLGDCNNVRPFHSAVRRQADIEHTDAQFNLILMDPPWPNSSVSRARKSGYQIAPSMWEIRQLLFDMEIDVLLAQNGLIGVWITNKPAVRELVLGEDGLFDSWGVKLEEEWLYIKTTRSGDPVSSLDSLWRKPYEILLLGRKASSQNSNVGEEQNIKRRVIAAVPDLHSRKPCIKQLIEPLMPNPANYRALEIFARYSVAGWWAWGNEVIKFNYQRCWTNNKEY